MGRLSVQSGVSESFESGGNQGLQARCQGEEPPKSGHISAHKMVMHAHTPQAAQQSRGGVMDRDRKTEGGASSEPAFDVSQVCLRVRSLFGLTGVVFADAQIERGQGGARLEHNDVTCGAMTAVGVFE